MKNRIQEELEETMPKAPIKDLATRFKEINDLYISLILENRPKSYSIFAKSSKAEERRRAKRHNAIVKAFAPVFESMRGRS